MLFSRIRTYLLATLLAAAFTTPTVAAPILWSFSYAGSGVSASGTFLTNKPVSRSYFITGISGSRNGTPIDALLAPGAFEINDNLLFPAPQTFFGEGGVSFDIAGGTKIDLFYTNREFRLTTITSLIITPASVPETSSFGTIILGVFILAGARR